MIHHTRTYAFHRRWAFSLHLAHVLDKYNLVQTVTYILYHVRNSKITLYNLPTWDTQKSYDNNNYSTEADLKSGEKMTTWYTQIVRCCITWSSALHTLKHTAVTAIILCKIYTNDIVCREPQHCKHWCYTTGQAIFSTYFIFIFSNHPKLTKINYLQSTYLSAWYSKTTEVESNSLNSAKESASKLNPPKALPLPEAFMLDFIMASRRPSEVCQQPIKYPKIPVPTLHKKKKKK